jgi:hypothetical protein
LDFTKVCFDCTEILDEEFYEDGGNGGEYIDKDAGTEEQSDDNTQYDDEDMVDDTVDL